jgi:hypothetical protein
MRREALPIRNCLRVIGGGATRSAADDVNDREAKVVILQRDHDREECRRQHHLKAQKEDRQQSSAKAKKKKKGGGVRANMEEGKTIARNREYWENMCGNKKSEQGEQGSTPQAKRERERGQTGTPTEEEPSNSNDDSTPARRGAREHTRHKPPTTNGPHDEIMGGGARGAPASGRGQNYEESETDGPRPWELCKRAKDGRLLHENTTEESQSQ